MNTDSFRLYANDTFFYSFVEKETDCCEPQYWSGLKPCQSF